MKNSTASANEPAPGRRGPTKKERIDIILQEMRKTFPQPDIPLQHEDPFSLLVAVLLSAQCTDERVNKVTPALFARAATAAEMARVPEAEILSYIKTCGLGPRKAKAIRHLSEILMQDYGGEVPRNLAALEALPGVGHKTAQVVMVQAFGVPAFPVDTHIHRLAQRWGLTSGKSVEQTEKDLKRLFPEDSWSDLHLQIIYYGRAFCTARTRCDGSGDACPLCPLFNGWRRRPQKIRKA